MCACAYGVCCVYVCARAFVHACTCVCTCMCAAHMWMYTCVYMHVCCTCVHASECACMRASMRACMCVYGIADSLDPVFYLSHASHSHQDSCRLLDWKMTRGPSSFHDPQGHRVRRVGCGDLGRNLRSQCLDRSEISVFLRGIEMLVFQEEER